MGRTNSIRNDRYNTPSRLHLYLSDLFASWYMLRGFLNEHPESAMSRDQYGATALYKALYRRIDDYPPQPIVQLLLDLYPPAMWIDNPRQCPLNTACWRRASLAILQLLVNCRPSRPRDIESLYALWRSYENLFEITGGGNTLIETITEGGREGAEIWTKLHLLLFYCTCNVTTATFLSLHAAAATPTCTLDELRLSFSFFEYQIRHRDEHGKLPIHYLVALKEVPGDDNNEIKSIMSKLQQLLEWYPKAISCRENVYMRLPLHIAIASGQEWELVQLLSISTDTLSEVDGITRLYPFQLAACTKDSSLTVTFELLRAAPHLMQTWKYPDVGHDRSITNVQSDGSFDVDMDVNHTTTEEMMLQMVETHDDLQWHQARQLLSYRTPENNWSVLHAATSLSKCPHRLLEAAVIIHSSELSQRCPGGDLPLHRLIQVSLEERDQDDGDEDEQDTRTRLIKIALKHCPQAASTRDRNGRLPLHMAISSSLPWPSLKAIIQAYPSAISEKQQGLYPFQIAAAHISSGLSEVYELLLTAPHLLCADTL